MLHDVDSSTTDSRVRREESLGFYTVIYNIKCLVQTYNGSFSYLTKQKQRRMHHSADPRAASVPNVASCGSDSKLNFSSGCCV